MKEQIDWQVVKAYTQHLLNIVRDYLYDFLVADPRFRATSDLWDYPPRIALEFELRPADDQRLKELYGNEDCQPRLAVIPDDDKRICASFVAEMAETLELRPRLVRDRDGQLRYTLKLNYEGLTDKRSQTRTDEDLLPGVMRDKDEWMYRAVMFSRVLEHLGYNPHNIMNASKEQLSNGVLKSPEKIIEDFQI